MKHQSLTYLCLALAAVSTCSYQREHKAWIVTLTTNLASLSRCDPTYARVWLSKCHALAMLARP